MSNLPVKKADQIARLIFSGKTVPEVARALGIENHDEVYDLVRDQANLIRERNVRYEIDTELIKYKVLNTLTETLESENEYNRMMASRTLLDYIMPKRDKTEGMVVINFGMSPPVMPDSPTYVYSDGTTVEKETPDSDMESLGGTGDE